MLNAQCTIVVNFFYNTYLTNEIHNTKRNSLFYKVHIHCELRIENCEFLKNAL